MRGVFFLVMGIMPLKANEAYQQGKAYADSLKPVLPAEVSLSEVPGYTSTPPQEIGYYQACEKLSDEATRRTQDPSQDVGAIAHRSQEEARGYRFSEKDTFIQEANALVKDPLQAIGGHITQGPPSGQEALGTEETGTCEESGEPEEYTCVQTRLLRTEKPELSSQEITVSFQVKDYHPHLNFNILTQPSVSNLPYNTWHTTGIDTYGDASPRLSPEVIARVTTVAFVPGTISACPGCHVSLEGKGTFVMRASYVPAPYHHVWYRSKVLVTYRSLLEEKDFKESVDTTCAALEKKVGTGECMYGTTEILEGEETREIQGVKIHRPWWKRKVTYLCRAEALNNCDSYRARGCTQTGSTCQKTQGSRCVVYQQSFLCPKRRLVKGQVVFQGEVPFCLDGNCDIHAFDPNPDFAEAMAKLSVFREMAKDMDGAKACAFRGQVGMCSKATLNFQDCCGSGGWGSSVGLGSGCKEEEKLLQKNRAAGKCVYVGTFCAEKEKLTGICLRKKSSYCCFGTKLARLIQHQGRAQLGLGFGSASSPDCRALSLGELQRLDFNTLNFAELYQDIHSRTHLPKMTQTVTDMHQKFADRIRAAKPSEGPKKSGQILPKKEEDANVF